jgi:hypothetical protein
MVTFQTKNPNLGKFWRATDWKMLLYIMAIWNILQTFGKFYDHLEHFVFIWCIFAGFGIVYQEKSGNPDSNPYRLQTLDSSSVTFQNILGPMLWFLKIGN